MNRPRFVTRCLAAAAGLSILGSQPLLACATCFGQSDSALAQGMNMGILSLLGVIGMVLSGVAGFFIFLARKSAHVANNAPPEFRETTHSTLV
jgi:hypothetical protein